MADYTGEKCIVCGKAFGKGEDVVVCPDCGTPYHRTCYDINSRCVNDALHAAGGEWQPSQRRKPLQNEYSPMSSGAETEDKNGGLSAPLTKIKDFFIKRRFIIVQISNKFLDTSLVVEG